MDDPRRNADPQSPTGHSVDRDAWIAERREAWTLTRIQLRRAETLWSLARLATFLATAGACFALRELSAVTIGIVAAGLAVFACCVVRHRRAAAARLAEERRLIVLEECLIRSGGRIVAIRSPNRPDAPRHGAPTLPSALPESRDAALSEQERGDLDLYASPCGLFGLLNRCSSALGARRLRDWLECPLARVADIAARRSSITWLAEHAERRMNSMAAVAALRDQDTRVDTLLETVANARPLPKPQLMLALRIWSIPSLLFTAVAIILVAFGHTQVIMPWLLLTVLHGGINHALRKPLARSLAGVKGLSPAVRALHIASSGAVEELPDQTALKAVRDLCSAMARHDVLPALGRRIEWADTGGLVHTLLNLIAFYDVHVADSLTRRLTSHRDTLLAGAGAIADLEALASLAAFAWEQPVTCYPDWTDATQLTLTAGVHPLIDPDEAIANNVALGDGTRTWIVSGSNMAGKSTFLRMVATNVILAQTGGAACARSMTLKPLRLVSDLRIRDDLARHESYFLAEVRQVRRMLENRADLPLLGLIDELFRGTNSGERIASSIALIAHLAAGPNLFIVATHEQALIEQAESIGARNYHFRESIDATGPVFDYRLRTGPATVRNAIQILAREGFTETIVAHARRIETEGI